MASSNTVSRNAAPTPTAPSAPAPTPTCQKFRAGETYVGKQGLEYFSGVSAETAGSTGLCMHLLTMPPGARAKAHLHENHETAIYVLSGVSEMWYGDTLSHHMVVKAGDILYIPAGVPHLPMNRSDAPVTAVIARTDPNEQESVRLLPELEERVAANPEPAAARGQTDRPETGRPHTGLPDAER